MAFRQEIVDKLLSYDVGMDGDVYAQSLFGSWGPTDLFDTMEALLVKREHVGVVGLIVRELVLLGWQGDGVAAFNELYEGSKVVQELQNLVMQGDFWDRRQAIYVLGKTYVKSAVPVLTKALGHWLESDPLVLPRVFFERSFLDTEIGADSYDPIINSKNFMTRWAALQILTEGALAPEVVPGYFERLKEDPHPLVAAAAKYEGRLAMKPQPGASPEAIQEMLFNNAEPPDPDLIAFVNVENWFTNFLRKNKRVDYSTEELESFVVNIVPQLVAGRRAALA